MNLPNQKHTPFIIGLTGAIGTGKSLVRKMLEQKGALTIDADLLAHEAYAKDSHGYQAVIRQFGNVIMDKNGEIDRQKLGSLVFNDSKALAELEALIHPLVSQAFGKLMNLSPLPIIVVEAIKLLDSDLKDRCNEIWVITSPKDQVYKRLARSRDMSSAQVDGRLENQRNSLPENSLVGIANAGTFKELQQRVTTQWESLSEHSQSFKAAASSTRQILKPFENFLFSPDETTTSGYFTKEINSYQYYLWRPSPSVEESSYFLSSINNFTAVCEIGTFIIDIALLKECLVMVGSFSRLHLCQTLSIICSNEDEKAILQQGFVKCDKPPAPPLHPYPLGYNHLCRQLLPPLELFREN